MHAHYLAILVGDSAAGKTSLLRTYTNLPFIEAFQETIGIDYYNKSLYFNGNERVYRFWDTSSEPGFMSFWKKYLIKSYAYVIVLDLTNRQTYDRVPTWIDYAKNSKSNWGIIIIVGNKCDLYDKRLVSYEECIELAAEFGGVYIECSATDYQSVEVLFETILNDYYKKVFM